MVSEKLYHISRTQNRAKRGTYKAHGVQHIPLLSGKYHVDSTQEGYITYLLYSLMLLDAARQTAWKPFPVSASSDVSVIRNEFPDERE